MITMRGDDTAPQPGNIRALTFRETSRLRAAALHARRTLPGPLGELVARELRAYADFGYRFSTDALLPRLANQVLATLSPADEAAGADGDRPLRESRGRLGGAAA